MLVYIKAYEGTYEGLHGMYEEDIIEVSSLEDAEDIALEMAESVVSSYDCFNEDEDEDGCEIEYLRDIYKIKDEYTNTYSVKELLDKLYDIGEDDFFETFCEEI